MEEHVFRRIVRVTVSDTSSVPTRADRRTVGRLPVAVEAMAGVKARYWTTDTDFEAWTEELAELRPLLELFVDGGEC